eukprot:560613-Rhodomonas_salina.1
MNSSIHRREFTCSHDRAPTVLIRTWAAAKSKTISVQTVPQRRLIPFDFAAENSVRKKSEARVPFGFQRERESDRMSISDMA